jgi:hypothetical protein
MIFNICYEKKLKDLKLKLLRSNNQTCPLPGAGEKLYLRRAT